MPNVSFKHSSSFTFQPTTPARLTLVRIAQAVSALAPAAEAVATVSLSVFLACMVRWTPRPGRQQRTKSRTTAASATPTASES
jgi:hypothetical protein